MHSDKQMTSEEESIPLNVQSSNLNEELGQIEYVFTDKTGTLTCNKMDFKCISIEGISYGILDPSHPKYINDYKDFPNVTNVDFRNGELIQILRSPTSPEYKNVKKCIFFLSICHSAVVETDGEHTNYSASSPDEMAFINFAKFCGTEFKGINDNHELIIKFEKKEKYYKLLYEFEFSSERKRHTIIFQNAKKEISLFCKGADSIIENLLDINTSRKNQ